MSIENIGSEKLNTSNLSSLNNNEFTILFLRDQLTFLTEKI